jgi:hypothetical protein
MRAGAVEHLERAAEVGRAGKPAVPGHLREGVRGDGRMVGHALHPKKLRWNCRKKAQKAQKQKRYMGTLKNTF